MSRHAPDHFRKRMHVFKPLDANKTPTAWDTAATTMAGIIRMVATTTIAGIILTTKTATTIGGAEFPGPTNGSE